MKKVIFALLLFISLGTEAQMIGLELGAKNAREAKAKAEGPAMSPQKNIVENIASSTEFSTLLMFLQSAGLIETLTAPGPYTFFAPANNAFAQISPSVLTSLSDDEHKTQLKRTLGFHVVSGRYDQNVLLKMIKDADGATTLTTLAGLPLTVTKKGKKIMISDGKKLQTTLEAADIEQSNGMIHIIDKVLMDQ